MELPLFDPAEVRATLTTLIERAAVFEIRVLNGQLKRSWRTGRVSGYFNNIKSCIAELARLTAFDGVYFTLNPVNSALLARRANRLDHVQERDSLTTDQHIEKRRYLLLDVDPVRPTGISATDSEKKRAEKKASEIADYLTTKHGWPVPIKADSGNGYHLIYRVDLPADDGELIKELIARLADRFDGDGVELDRAVFNASRIVRLYGTAACKGDDIKDRPHRLSKMVSQPE